MTTGANAPQERPGSLLRQARFSQRKRRAQCGPAVASLGLMRFVLCLSIGLTACAGGAKDDVSQESTPAREDNTEEVRSVAVLDAGAADPPPEPECTNTPHCGPGDLDLGADAMCPAGATCYTRTACGGKATHCKKGATSCQLLPVCNPGDEAIDKKAECPTGVTCYDRTKCGRTIWCIPS